MSERASGRRTAREGERKREMAGSIRSVALEKARLELGKNFMTSEYDSQVGSAS